MKEEKNKIPNKNLSKPSAKKKPTSKLFIGKKLKPVSLEWIFLFYVSLAVRSMVLVHAEISSKPERIEKTSQTTFIEVSRRFFFLLQNLPVCGVGGWEESENNNSRGLYMTSLLLKGHSEWNIVWLACKIKFLVVFVFIAADRVLWWLWLLFLLVQNSLCTVTKVEMESDWCLSTNFMQKRVFDQCLQLSLTSIFDPNAVACLYVVVFFF